MASYKKSEDTKNKILKAAAELFCEKGYYNTTVKEICDRTGVSVSRVNYHFMSKADLAANICGIFLENFYIRVKDFIGNTREYSLLSETIQLRFFVQILLDPSGTCPIFYHEIARDGILSEAFTRIAEEKYHKVNASFHYLNMSDARIAIAAKIYASALSAIIDKNAAANFGCSVEDLMDAFASLFMQLADMPHDVQDAILDKARMHGRNIGYALDGLTDIRLFRISAETETD